jgi:hypothetical protein
VEDDGPVEPQIQPPVSFLSYFGKDRDIIPQKVKEEMGEGMEAADDS